MNRIPDAIYLGQPEDFVPSDADRILIGIGSVAGRKKMYKIAQNRHFSFVSYIHPSAWIASNARIGDGVIICPNCVVSAFAEIADNAAINVFCGVGHGARVGEHTVMGPYSVINGDTSLGEGCFLGSRATLFPKVSLGRGCIVDAHSVVKMSAGDFKIVSVRGQYLVLDNKLAARDMP
jgi:UDP-3-O-[3-hydroxymyristoyl] glucosamine N-acyltransferase